MTTLETLLTDPDTVGVWNLDAERSTVNFKIRNFWGLVNVKGRFTDVGGDGQITGEGALCGRLDIQVASLRTGIGKRDEHLRSADFFDADRYPKISVEVAAVEPTGGNTGDLRATFSIKGVTAPVTLPVAIKTLDDGSVQVSTHTEVDRDQFDLGWNRLGMVAKTATAWANAYFVRAPR
ncbi:MAG TPA: YceI family protein [Mycobacterium sp.]|jgi:polyisoprenoid-binding protein YceI|uniref:YceI family protein n=1 Tax=Mycobacterium sp. TaxID=1785 RepID=UPI002F3EA970